jgi:plastocyanin
VIGRNGVGTERIVRGRGPIAQVVVIALASALGLGLAVVGRAPVTHAAAYEITIVDFAFEPAKLTVFTGEPVTWTNNGATSHTVTSDAGTELDSGPISPGETFGHVFETPGTFTYHCTFHPTQMIATIIVRPTPSPTPAASPTPTPSATSSPSDGGGIGGFLGTLWVVVVVGGVGTYLVRAFARRQAEPQVGPKSGPKSRPKSGPKSRPKSGPKSMPKSGPKDRRSR